MPEIYSDELFEITVPSDWKVETSHWCAAVIPENGYNVSISFRPDINPDGSSKYGNTAKLNRVNPSLRPLVINNYSGLLTHSKCQDGIVTDHAVFLIDDICVDISFCIATDDVDLFWKAFASLKLHSRSLEALKKIDEARQYQIPDEFGNDSDEKLDDEVIEVNATDLTKLIRKSMTAWMDHFMMLLCNDPQEPFGEANFTDGAPIIAPCDKHAIWVTSKTEFDVKLDFVFRSKRPQTRKVWWRDEDEHRLSLPSGHLYIEAAAGGTMMDAKVKPGDYTILVRRHYPENVETDMEGVERIEVNLFP